MKKLEIKIGDRFGKYTIKSNAIAKSNGGDGKSKSHWRAKCECGTTILKSKTSLLNSRRANSGCRKCVLSKGVKENRQAFGENAKKYYKELKAEQDRLLEENWQKVLNSARSDSALRNKKITVQSLKVSLREY